MTRPAVLISLVALTIPATVHGVEGDDFAKAAGPRAHLHVTPSGVLRLGTHLDLAVDANSDDGLFETLFQRFPDVLPIPRDLRARTRSWTFGSIDVLQRTWTWHDIPVKGLSLTLHRDPAGHVRVISAPGLGYGPARRLTPAIPAQAARARAEALVIEELGVPPLSSRERLEILASSAGLSCVWTVSTAMPPPYPPITFQMDGWNGEVLAVFPGATDVGRPSSTTASWGTVFESSFLDGETVEVSLPYLDGSGTLSGSFVNVWQYDPDTPPTFLSQTPGTLSAEAWYFDFPPTEVYTSSGPTAETQTDAFAEVMMYYHVNQIHTFFNDLGYYNDDPLAGIDRSMQAVVNYRGPAGFYDNAYYASPSGSAPGQIVFGQGEATDFSYDSSVIYHEYGHAVVNGSSDYANYCLNDVYGSDCTQGGLNEGTADYFSAALRGDPEIGAYALGEWLPEYARNLTDPNRCPDDLYGEEHEDGKVWGGGLWDVRLAVAGDNIDAANATIDPVILATVTTPLGSDFGAGSAFSQAADILLTDAAIQFGATSAVLDTISASLRNRGLLACTRFVPLTSGVSKEGAFSTATRPGRQSVTVAGLQYMVEVSDNASSFSFYVTSEAGIQHLTLYARKDQPVQFAYTGNTVSSVTADYTFEETTSFTLDGTTSPPLEPGTYYVTFSSPQTLSTALWGHYYSVKATVASSFNPEDHTAHGCGCTHDTPAPASRRGAALLGLVVAAAWLMRTRRSPAR